MTPVMSLLPAYFGRKRNDDLAPERAPESETREDVFNLIPPRAANLDHPFAKPDKLDKPDPEKPETKPQKAKGSAIQSVGLSDLTRLGFDKEGRLYWDGKPVEVRRRLEMSRSQVIGTTLIAMLIFIAALGAAIQASFAAHAWACKAGWAKSYCGPPVPEKPPVRTDIPA
jgi:hypothetical protein